MGTWVNDRQLLALMRAFVASAGRLEQAECDASLPESEVAGLRMARHRAAEAFEAALLSRGWHIPGHVVGPLGRAHRW
jgi:hypothetical protein